MFRKNIADQFKDLLEDTCIHICAGYKAMYMCAVVCARFPYMHKNK